MRTTVLDSKSIPNNNREEMLRNLQVTRQSRRVFLSTGPKTSATLTLNKYPRFKDMQEAVSISNLKSVAYKIKYKEFCPGWWWIQVLKELYTPNFCGKLEAGGKKCCFLREVATEVGRGDRSYFQSRRCWKFIRFKILLKCKYSSNFFHVNVLIF